MSISEKFCQYNILVHVQYLYTCTFWRCAENGKVHVSTKMFVVKPPMINTLFQPGFPVNTMYIHLMYLEVLLLFVEGRQLPDSAVSYIHVCTANLHVHLKPQDSFGELDNFFLDLQKVQEIITKHHQTFLQLFWMTYCNAILPHGKLSLCTYITYDKVFGGTLNIFMFWIFPENGSISERTVHMALIVHTTL